ncbi:alpha/beta hydrolase [Labrys okinawensis]|uniref:alpha/beta hydrolase n=1 Tax=Labrys okinawensis TaxID=346911 RepID=UPI0039BC97CB
MDSSRDTEISWATSPPALLREHHLADAILQEGPLPDDVGESELGEEGAFRGGLLFTPPRPKPGVAIVYFHGGGFLAGSPRTHRGVTAWLAHFAGMPVLSARYRLTPEYPFPAQRDDAVAACAKASSLFTHGGDFRLFLSGDSAGACVSLWGLLGLPPQHRATVAGLALFYGGFGLTESASITRAGTPENGLDAEALRSMYGRLLDGKKHVRIDEISPLSKAAAIHEPTYILAAAEDAVFDDSLALHRKLELNGSATHFISVPGMDHGFLKQAGKLAEATDSLKDAASWMKGKLATAPPP